MTSNWLRTREDAEPVQPEALLMELPEISEQDWQRAAVQYLAEAGQLSFFLRQRASEAETLLDQADEEIGRGNQASATLLLRNAWTQLHGADPIEKGLPTCVRAGLLADRVGDKELQVGIIPGVSASLRELGLEDVAHVLQNYGQIASEFGEETANLLRIGTIARINDWAFNCEMREGQEV